MEINDTETRNYDAHSLANRSLRLGVQASMLRARAAFASGDVADSYREQADKADAERRSILSQLPKESAYHA